MWQTVATTIDTLDEHDLWESDFFAAFAPLRDLVGDDDDAARQLVHTYSSVLGFGLLSEVNTITYRTDDVMLSTAQDHRPGVYGEQYHAWQATLDEDALVFTTHPRTEPEIGTEWPDSDGWWTGTGSMPRSAQHEAAGIHLYAPTFDPDEIPLPFGYVDRTHAYFPVEHFDEVVEADGWTMGRAGDGYVALWSWRDTEWVSHGDDGVYTGTLTDDFDLVADGGPDNVWIVEVGDADSSGSFEDFQAAVTAETPEVEPRPETDAGLPGGFDVTWTSPSAGTMAFGTTGDLTVDGETVALNDYPRYDNPWAQAAFGDRLIEITDDEGGVTLDFDSWEREAE